MPTISFEREIIIESDEAVEVLIRGMNGELNQDDIIDSGKIMKELQRGKALLSELVAENKINNLT